MSDSPNMEQAPAPGGGLSDKDAQMWAMLAHLSALVGCVIPFGNIGGPLVIWLVKKEESPFVDDQGKEAVNFQICFTIYMLIASLTFLVCIGAILVPALGIVGIVFIVIAAVKANGGEKYRYPLTFRLVK